MKGTKGQTITEFAIVAAMFAVVAATMLILLSVFSQYGVRILSLVGLDYP